MIVDPLGTTALREAVWSAWSNSSTRFREDANLEADHARTHYRDRVVVELAQNAADAAAHAGAPGTLLLRLTFAPDGTGELLAANTGTPLDEAGVRSLASLRASAKDPVAGAVGRFGVGFAAVRSVADEILLGAGPRAVRFSLAQASAEIRAHASLVPEAASRGRDLPVLRLPYPGTVDVPPGYDTAVVLRLRDADAVAAVRHQLDLVDDSLALALPALEEILVEDGPQRRRIGEVTERWRIERRSGPVDPSLVADRPTEDRPTSWSVTWALPRDGSRPPDRYRAPTPTDEASGFGALLIATFPLDPSRRHVVPGPLTDLLADRAGEAYADLLTGLAREGGDALDLVPMGLPAGDLDAQVRSCALDALRDADVLPGPSGSAPLAPANAVVVEGTAGADRAVVDALPLEGLAVPGPRGISAARELGARMLSLADAVAEANGFTPEALWSLCDALSPHADAPGVLDAVASLSVPLAGGGVAFGPRGLLLPAVGEAVGVALADVPGLRVVAPGAAHPLLERVGAVPADGPQAAEVLRRVVEDLAEAAANGEDPDPDLSDAVLRVARAITLAGHELPFWWGEFPVPTAAGNIAVRECLLPGSWADTVFDGLEPAPEDLIDQYGADTMIALGIVQDIGVWQVIDVVTAAEESDLDESGPESWLAHWSEYLEYLADVLGPGALVGDLSAVADLDAVAQDSWETFLARVQSTPEPRAAVLERVRSMAGGDDGEALSYTAWWFREEFGAPFARTRAVPFLRQAPPEYAGLDDRLAGALGVVNDLAELDAAGWSVLDESLPETGTEVSAIEAMALWQALPAAASASQAGGVAGVGAARGAGPQRLPAIDRGRIRVLDVADLVVAADPRWAPLLPVLPVPTGAAAVASWLGTVLAPPGPSPDSTGRPLPLAPALVRITGTAQWWEHEALRVDGVAVDWWIEDSPAGQRIHATGPISLASALAASNGRYGARHLMVALLDDPKAADRLVATFAWDITAGSAPSMKETSPNQFGDSGPNW